ncbi:MAG: Cytochrome [Cyanobacteria bacterium RYN_339]|nr:Cytochrome [Cyanobacteria bacterium RYN_339]
MDFPVFEFPYLGTRYLIALIAVLHVVINHGAAIGGSLVTVLLERKGFRDGDPRYEALAYRLAAVFFVLTTTVGALSGVGIWFSTMVGQPAAIGSMLRIFFWAWFLEWIVFVVEVALVMVYFLTWRTFQDKRTHLRVGWAYVAASGATMAIITGILGFMLTPGAWHGDHSLWSAFLNPTYLPQLVLRSGLALGLGASLALVLTRWLAPADFQAEASRYLGRFFFAAVPLIALGGMAYLFVLPDAVRGLVPTALVTSRFIPYVQASYAINAVICLALLGFGWQARRRALPIVGRLAAFVALVCLLGQFERVREFARKPYMIPGYMYANGLREADRAKYDRDGILAHARYPDAHPGRAVFKLECASCHTLGGMNDPSVPLKGQSAAAIDPFIASLHEVHPFMPPFMGTAKERRALAEFLASEAR